VWGGVVWGGMVWSGVGFAVVARRRSAGDEGSYVPVNLHKNEICSS